MYKVNLAIAVKGRRKITPKPLKNENKSAIEFLKKFPKMRAAENKFTQLKVLSVAGPTTIR